MNEEATDAQRSTDLQAQAVFAARQARKAAEMERLRAASLRNRENRERAVQRRQDALARRRL